MGTKKRTRKLLNAIKSVFDPGVKTKNLKKASAFRDLIDKLVDRRAVIIQETQAGKAGNKRKKHLSEQRALLDTQIRKARKILKTIEEKK